MLVINGGHDRLTPPKVASAIARKYGATYRQYDRCGHYIMRENAWEQVARDTHDWLCDVLALSGTPHARSA